MELGKNGRGGQSLNLRTLSGLREGDCVLKKIKKNSFKYHGWILKGDVNKEKRCIKMIKILTLEMDSSGKQLVGLKKAEGEKYVGYLFHCAKDKS